MGGGGGHKSIGETFAHNWDRVWGKGFQAQWDNISGRKDAKETKTNMEEQGRQQAMQTAALEQSILTQPKTISPDNFLADKAAQLANLRLGIASTITGAQGAPPPVLKSPTLSGNYPGKAKLGQ